MATVESYKEKKEIIIDLLMIVGSTSKRMLIMKK